MASLFAERDMKVDSGHILNQLHRNVFFHIDENQFLFVLKKQLKDKVLLKVDLTLSTEKQADSSFHLYQKDI